MLLKRASAAFACSFANAALPTSASRIAASASSLAAASVTLSNPGATPLKITGIKISRDFAETNSSPKEFTTGKDCTIGVRFSPTASGTLKGTVTAKASALTSSQTIALSGTGIL